MLPAAHGLMHPDPGHAGGLGRTRPRLQPPGGGSPGAAGPDHAAALG
jgi:hypothetical protein